MYDELSADYDRFVNWEARLAAELPFLCSQLQKVDARRVLDAACGTGMHAIALAKRGYKVVGTDLSTGMIKQARINAAHAGVDVQFEVAGLGELEEVLAETCSATGGDDPHLASSSGRGQPFDAVLCLGNSLPHVLTRRELVGVLRDFAACLNLGGLLLVQNRNFDAVLAERSRWMSPEDHSDEEQEWLFVRFYDFRPDGLLRFNILRLHRRTGGEWRQQVISTRLWPQTFGELTEALRNTGYQSIRHYGDLEGTPFSIETSPNLVIAAHRSNHPKRGEP